MFEAHSSRMDTRHWSNSHSVMLKLKYLEYMDIRTTVWKQGSALSPVLSKSFTRRIFGASHSHTEDSSGLEIMVPRGKYFHRGYRKDSMELGVGITTWLLCVSRADVPRQEEGLLYWGSKWRSLPWGIGLFLHNRGSGKFPPLLLLFPGIIVNRQ